jgi:hypothetical protein
VPTFYTIFTSVLVSSASTLFWPIQKDIPKKEIQFIDCTERFYHREQKHPKDLRLLDCTDSAQSGIAHRNFCRKNL